MINTGGSHSQTTWIRLTTFNSAPPEEIENDQHLSGAIGSTEARKQLQIRAIKLTLQHPVFGVGPRMFVYALNGQMIEEGYRKGTWQRPHNTYLDISSETGLIGLGFYVGCIIWCLRTNYRSAKATRHRPDLKPAMAQSYSLLLASAVYAVGTLFCSLPYLPHMPFLLGLTAANWLALRDAGVFAVPARLPGGVYAGRFLPKRQRDMETQQALCR